MDINIDNKVYKVIIHKKVIKNAYIRVNDDKEVILSINKYVSEKEAKKLIEKNIDNISKMIEKIDNKKHKKDKIYLFNKEYDVILNTSFNEIDYENHKLYITNRKNIDNILKKEAFILFEEMLLKRYNEMNLNVALPKLKIRKMRTRWGVCNRKDHSVTLNLELIKHSKSEIDYVIVHELSHFVYFDHSKNFWNLVEVYYPDYKKVRKILKE